ncbi:MAG: ribonuclease H-like domain-containing protein [Clostridium sp.]|uniref:ribonuclease H-like domain-containing protein n=1 Tax=Clostridium sp. TaxID=1506 RepID=UPI0039EA731E
MFLKERNSKIDIDVNMLNKYKMDKIAYFDIETTGFDKDEDVIMLISLGYFLDKKSFYIKQYYAENTEEEKNILFAFKEDLKKYRGWCSYNGKAFDEPFIANRMLRNDINDFIPPSEHVDLYRLIRPYYKQLGMERCNLKSVEKYIGINRLDKIDGGISVELYNKYLKTNDEKLKDIIMLHNYEDVLNLPKLFKVIFDIDKSEEVVRDNSITEKQLRYLKFLLNKNNVNIDTPLERISKRAASKVIDNLLKGNSESEELLDIINNSY